MRKTEPDVGHLAEPWPELADSPAEPGSGVQGVADGRRWVLLAGLIAVYFAFAVAVSSIAPMLNLVRDDLGATRGEMGLALGAWAAMFIVTAPLAGRFVDRLGVSLSIGIGGLFIAASLAARAAASGVGTLWLAIAIFGIGGPLISVGAPALVRIWFANERERRLAVALYVLAPGLGGVTTVAITNPVLLPAFGGWRQVLIAEACFALAMTALWAVMARSVARSRPRAKSEAATAPAESAKSQVAALLRSPGVRFSLATAFSIFFVNHALSAWFPAALEDLGGFSSTVASNWVAASGVVAILVALVIPPLAQDRYQRGIFAAAFGLAVVAILALAYGPMTTAVPAALAIGTRGVLVPIGILILMNSDGVNEDNAGVANGLWFSVGEIGGVTGPITLGIVADSSLGFSGALAVTVAIASAAAVIALSFNHHLKQT